jgi:divalent metal cation (Fe/Co/Zn/Cd) transporter
MSLVRALHQVRTEAAMAGRRSVEHVAKSADPAVKTVASEDSIAVFGVVVAAVGVAAHQATWEGVASAIIGALLIFAACVLARDNMSLLIRESVEPSVVASIQATVSDHPMVEGVVELLTRYLGPHDVLVAVRVELVDGLSSNQIETMSSDIDARLHQANPEVTQVFLDATTSQERRRTEIARAARSQP